MSKENKRIIRRYLKMVGVLVLWGFTAVLVIGITTMISSVVWRLFI